MDDVDSGGEAGTGSTARMCSVSPAFASTVPSVGASRSERKGDAAAFGRRKGPCTGRDAGSPVISTLLPAEEDEDGSAGVADVASVGFTGSCLCTSDWTLRGEGEAGALYLGLVGSEKVDPGGADRDVGSIREEEDVDKGAAWS